MFKTLRNRLIISHVLPLLVIIPLLGIVLIYLLETRYLLPRLTEDLVGNAALLGQFSRVRPEVWSSPSLANALLLGFSPQPTARVMLLTTSGRLLASSDSANLSYIGTILDIPGLEQAQQGQIVRFVYYTESGRGAGQNREEGIDVMVPVAGLSPGGETTGMLGIVRMTYPYTAVYERFSQLRYLILVLLLIGLASGAILGSILALSINRPIQRVTQAVYRLAGGEMRTPLAETGPEEIRLLARAVNYLVERLKSLESARRQLLSNLVHELGRPLGALRSAIQALGRGAAQDPKLLADLTTGMDEETVHLRHLLDDLAHLHDQVVGGLELHRQPVPIGEWLHRILSPWQATALEKGLSWQLQAPMDLPAVNLDPVRMAQAVENLVSNAIRYTPAGGEVVVSAMIDNEQALIRVSDNGPGIPYEEQEKIFQPYYRGQYGRRIKQGMGLGLSIARDVVMAHDGRLELKSNPGEGSQFTISLRLP